MNATVKDIHHTNINALDDPDSLITPYNSDPHCIRLKVNFLTPNTMYSVSLVAYGGGGKGGDSTKLMLTTEAAVPSSPPNHLYFSREVSDIQSHYSSKVTVTWQPLASDLHGGEGLHYKLDLYNGEVLERTIFTNNTFAVLDKLPSAKMEARVWAVNILGQSYDYTSIALPLHIGMHVTSL